MKYFLEEREIRTCDEIYNIIMEKVSQWSTTKISAVYVNDMPGGINCYIRLSCYFQAMKSSYETSDERMTARNYKIT